MLCMKTCFAWRRLGWGDDPTVDGSLTTQLLQDFGSTSETITRFADGDVEDELVNAQLTHGVGALVFAFRHLDSVIRWWD